MTPQLVKPHPVQPPKELLSLLDHPPLLSGENIGDYQNLCAALVAATNPRDPIDWLYVNQVAQLAWDMRRETRIKVATIELARIQIIEDLLKKTMNDPTSIEAHEYRIFRARKDAQGWSKDPKSQKDIDKKLADKGYPPDLVLAMAYEKCGPQIDAIERRIASYASRQIVVLREIERRNDKFARQLEKASTDALDAEYTEAAE